MIMERTKLKLFQAVMIMALVGSNDETIDEVINDVRATGDKQEIFCIFELCQGINRI
jgi:hypothetical protein